MVSCNPSHFTPIKDDSSLLHYYTIKIAYDSPSSFRPKRSATRACDAAARASQTKEHKSQSCKAIWCAAILVAEASSLPPPALVAMAAAPKIERCSMKLRTKTDEDATTSGFVDSHAGILQVGAITVVVG